MKTFLFFLSVIFFLSLGNSFADDPQSQDDIHFNIINNSTNQNYIVQFTKVSNTNCYDANYSITTAYDNKSDTGTNYIAFVGCWKTGGGIPFGMGYYKIDIILEGQNTPIRTFYLDLRSQTVETNWNDLNFNYYCDTHALTIAGNSIADNSTQTFWNLNQLEGYSPIIRQISTWGTPHLVWDETSSAMGNYTRCNFIIYRSIDGENQTAICTTANGTTYSFYDSGLILNGGSTAHYQASARFFDGEIQYRECTKSNQLNVPIVSMNKKKGVKEQPSSFNLSNYPNPFNPSTKICFSLHEASNIQITIYNPYGQEVQQLFKGLKETGNHELQFDGKNLSSGVYYYTLKTDKFSETKKMVLMK
jgi:hypothetical protein